MQTNSIAVQLGERVRSSRLQAALTISDVADALHISTERLEAAERGDAPLTPDQVAQLCVLIGRKPSDLLDGLA